MTKSEHLALLFARLDVALVERLNAALVEDLDLEEREILPLASRHVTAAERNDMGEPGKDTKSPS